MSTGSRGSTLFGFSWCVAVVLCLLSLGVPVAYADEAPALDDSTENDPLEPLNRVTFEFNRLVLRYTARPVANAYHRLVPRPLRDGLRNGLDNLASPLLFGNQVLQGDAGAAARTLARFFVNTTAGIGGTIDVAGRLGIRRRHTDLGLTLGIWGLGEGPYLVLPLLGPSTLRDVLASFAQGYVDPFNFWVQNTDYVASYAFQVRFVLGNVDLYDRRLGELDSIEESSIDFYASLRSFYRGKRRADISSVVSSESPPPIGIDYNLDLETEEPEPPDDATPGNPASP